jgi:glucose/arabinose dehydrogenase
MIQYINSHFFNCLPVVKKIYMQRVDTSGKVSLSIVSISFILFFVITLATQCRNGAPSATPGNGGLLLPGNFAAAVVADSIGGARHLTVNDNGDIYVKLRNSYPDGSNVVLRDEDNDGQADVIKKFGIYTDSMGYGTAMRIYKDYVYFSSAGDVFRSKLRPGEMLPDTSIELILHDDFENDPHGANHIAKPITFDDKGNMYVPFGSPSDVCQELDRIPGSIGQQPCPQLAEHAGIWVFDPTKKIKRSKMVSDTPPHQECRCHYLEPA